MFSFEKILKFDIDLTDFESQNLYKFNTSFWQ